MVIEIGTRKETIVCRDASSQIILCSYSPPPREFDFKSRIDLQEGVKTIIDFVAKSMFLSPHTEVSIVVSPPIIKL